MSRIRTIKPEFAQSETIAKLSIPARLFFILLWTICDDQGRTRAAPALLKGLLYPYDSIPLETLREWTEELRSNGVILVYEIEDHHYIQVVNWFKHQKISHPSKPRLPAPPGYSGDPPEPSGDTPRGSHTSYLIPHTSTSTGTGAKNDVNVGGSEEGKRALAQIRNQLAGRLRV